MCLRIYLYIVEVRRTQVVVSELGRKSTRGNLPRSSWLESLRYLRGGRFPPGQASEALAVALSLFLSEAFDEVFVERAIAPYHSLPLLEDLAHLP